MDGTLRKEGQKQEDSMKMSGVFWKSGKLENENEKKIRNVDAKFPARGCTGISNKTMCLHHLGFPEIPYLLIRL